MAKIIVNVPDGEYCGGCRYLMRGTILCTLFDQLCEEDYDKNKIIKYEGCPRGDSDGT